MRLLRIFIVLALLVLIPFLIWGDRLMALFQGAGARQWILDRGPWGWAAVVGILISDLFLPIPATGVMSAAGYVFGPWVGGLLGTVGSFLGGALAYGLCRSLGRGVAEKLAGKEGLSQNEVLFRHTGPWLVALSRWLPILPEVVACLAGLARMPASHFFLALFCGTAPMAFTYAAVGALFETEPAWAIALSVALPGLLWLAFRPWMRARHAEAAADT
jgi:uncharacterized membrane protein YdjX (TVP38/TMEM64 family)